MCIYCIDICIIYVYGMFVVCKCVLADSYLNGVCLTLTLPCCSTTLIDVAYQLFEACDADHDRPELVAELLLRRADVNSRVSSE